MRTLKHAILAIGIAVTIVACGDKGTSSTETSSTPSASETQGGLAWADLDAKQKSVLSVGEEVWPSIPADKRASYADMAENWEHTEAADQKKMLTELRSYLKK